ncbi:MAG: DUF2849 domain-containing protein [Paracoccaceae bacterium]
MPNRRGKRGLSPQVLSAYDLRTGEVVYLGKNQTWIRRIEAASLLRDHARAADLLRRAEADQQSVIGATLIDALPGPGGVPAPVHFRESFRAKGPSNRFLGKQAIADKGF